ncbi:MAG TPA: ABC transporter permease, partial [Candidatus Methylomirabilis sp.]|nr:ABC transporter permease [Candidatus Methylomirabilis sp.]
MRPNRWFYTLPLRLRSLFRRGAVEQDLGDELQFHLEQKTREYVARGLTLEDARRKALREFGGLEQSKEDCRDTRRVRIVETTLQDIRFGSRMLRKNFGFTAIAVLTLGLGIGANTAIFSMVNSFLLRPLPVKDPGQITVLGMQLKKGDLQTAFSYPEFEDLQIQSPSVFSDVIAMNLNAAGLTFNGKTEPIIVDEVSGNFFTALGIHPLLGRFILPSEGSVTALNPVIVLGYSFWQTRFGGDPNIVGKTALYNGHPVTVIGITPKEFHGLFALADMQGYLPMGMQQVDSSYEQDTPTNRGFRNLTLYARLAPGVTLVKAQSALDVISDRLAKQNPKTEEGMTISVFPERFSRPGPDPDQSLLKVATLFLILAALVLVLACVNIANFLLVRATARQREMAIRTALGGTRLRLIRQLLTESVLLALCGGFAGVFFGLAGSNALSSIHLATTLPVLLDFHLDWRVFGYAFGAALATGLIVGIVPALRASRRGVIEAIRDGGRTMTGSRSPLRTLLVVLQVGGSLMLLIVAGLMTRSLNHAQRSDLGFDPRHVLNLTLDPNEIGYSKQQGLQFYNRLLERIQAMPGVESASVAFSVPMGYYNNYDWVDVPGYEVPHGAAPPIVGQNFVTPGYFRTMAIPLLEGRDFAKADVADSQWVAVVNEAFAKKFWPNQSAVGHEFRVAGDHVHSLRVVGVVRNSRTTGMVGPIREYFYQPFAQQYSSLAVLQVRTTFAPESMTSSIREQIASLAPSMPAFDVHTMLQGLYTINGFLLFQLAAALAGILGSLGLILALVGVFGVISFTVSQRTNEIGIRMAMGAARGSILRMILRQGVWIISGGVVAGVLLALAISRLVANFISGVSPYDPLTYLSVTAVLGAVALLACYFPARRATRVDPVV